MHMGDLVISKPSTQYGVPQPQRRKGMGVDHGCFGFYQACLLLWGALTMLGWLYNRGAHSVFIRHALHMERHNNDFTFPLVMKIIIIPPCIVLLVPQSRPTPLSPHCGGVAWRAGDLGGENGQCVDCIKIAQTAHFSLSQLHRLPFTADARPSCALPAPVDSPTTPATMLMAGKFIPNRCAIAIVSAIFAMNGSIATVRCRMLVDFACKWRSHALSRDGSYTHSVRNGKPPTSKYPPWQQKHLPEEIEEIRYGAGCDADR